MPGQRQWLASFIALLCGAQQWIGQFYRSSTWSHAAAQILPNGPNFAAQNWPPTKDAVCPTGYKCSFEIDDGVVCGICGSHFQDRKQLNGHKKDAGHIKRKVPAAGGEEQAGEIVDEPAEDEEQT